MSIFDFVSTADLQILKIFNVSISPAFDTFVLSLSYSIYLYALVLAFYFYRKNEKKKFVHFFVSIILGFITASILKYIIVRPRPYISHPGQIHPLLQEPDASFPSRHSFTALFLMRFIPKDISKFYKYLNILYLLSIPFSVMYIGIHYPTDVLVGSIIGYIFPSIVTEKISLRIWNLVVTRVPFLDKFLQPF